MNPLSRRELLSLGAAAGAASGARRNRPNILYIMADDHASHAISAYGSRINRTPNLDRIARGGARLDNCFCTNSICTPSRAAILTGQYSHKNGVYTLADRLDPSRDNVAKRLAERRLPDGHDRQVAPGDGPRGLRLLEHPAGPGRLLRSRLHRSRREEETPRLLHGPHRGLQPGLAQEARRHEALLPDVPPQGPAPAVGARAQVRAAVRWAKPSPSRTTFSTITRAVRRASRR